MSVSYDQFEHIDFGAAEAYRKQVLLGRVAFTFGGILTTYLLIITAMMPGISTAKILGAVSSVSLFAISRLCHYERFYKACAVAMIAITILAGFLASLTNDGLQGYVTPVLITAPIAAAFFLSVRATIVATGCVVCCFCLQIIADHFGLVSPTAYASDVTEFAALIMLATATAISAAGLAYYAHDSNKLIASMRTAQGRLIDLSQKFERSAYHDALTGLANRKKLHENLQRLLSQRDSQPGRVCLMHVDLDKFKEVNDTLGHPVGDGVLRNTARIMQEHFADSEIIARVGGDEFVIVKILADTDTDEGVKNACDTLIQSLKKPMSVNGVECQIDASIGYVYATAWCSNPEMMIANADIALYEAKRCGGGLAFAFNARMRERFDHRLESISDIEQGLEQDWFICVLQPQICMQTGRLIGLEGLSRLLHPEKGLLGTGTFIQLAEEIGVLDQIDLTIMRKALDHLISLRAQGFEIPAVSINVSAKTLRTVGYAQTVQAEVQARNLAQHDLVIEVLESVLIEGENDVAATTIAAIRAAGFRVVIDDFGSGHATLGNLARLDVDGLKIDRSLVPDPNNERATKIVEATLTLAEGLGVPAVIEGIETIEQYALLKSLGCAYAQGYLIAKPLEIQQLTMWLQHFGKAGAVRLQDALEGRVYGMTDDNLLTAKPRF